MEDLIGTVANDGSLKRSSGEALGCWEWNFAVEF